mmetsp:Transcript_35667/g.55679  ORF Transcript_35667/g.55679 Transcript_35667/m.55679 type:complete len:200 (-) Transcript_35667:1285-1884(-)
MNVGDGAKPNLTLIQQSIFLEISQITHGKSKKNSKRIGMNVIVGSICGKEIRSGRESKGVLNSNRGWHRIDTRISRIKNRYDSYNTTGGITPRIGTTKQKFFILNGNSDLWDQITRRIGLINQSRISFGGQTAQTVEKSKFLVSDRAGLTSVTTVCSTRAAEKRRVVEGPLEMKRSKFGNWDNSSSTSVSIHFTQVNQH